MFVWFWHVLPFHFFSFVQIAAALKAEILPRRLTVRSGDDVTVNCTYRGGPVREVRWLKDNKPLQNDHRVRLLGRLVLHISSFRRADTGMYQCFVNNEQDSAQGHAYLRIEGSYSLKVRFTNGTIHYTFFNFICHRNFFLLTLTLSGSWVKMLLD